MDKSLIKVAAMAREWSSVFLQQFSSVKGRHTTGKIWKMSFDITCIAHHTSTIIERYMETSLQISESHID